MRTPAKLLCLIAVSLPAVLLAAGKAPMVNYYEYDAPSVAPPPTAIPQAKSNTKPRSFIVDGTGGPGGDNSSSQPAGDSSVGSTPADSAAVPLPPNMERGVKDLEAGMEDLQRYTATMAAHVQKNGIRGFLALPSDIKEQGRAIGRVLGGGINGVATDVAQDMIASDRSE
jgi:hypothetical protein